MFQVSWHLKNFDLTVYYMLLNGILFFENLAKSCLALFEVGEYYYYLLKNI